MEELRTIALGVFAGVVTSALLYIFGLIFSRILVPWYQKVIYKGVDVSGEWTGTIDHSQRVHWSVKLDLEQNAHDLKGTYTSVRYVNDEERNLSTMNVTGEVWEGFVALKCRTISNRNLSFGSMLLKVNPNELTGHQIFRNLGRSNNEIFHKELTFQRRSD